VCAPPDLAQRTIEIGGERERADAGVLADTAMDSIAISGCASAFSAIWRKRLLRSSRQNRIKIPLAAYKQKNHNTINGRGTGVHAQGLCAGLAQHCFASCTLGEAHETASDQATTAGQPRVRMNANKLWEESNEQSKDPAP
jgi:hypothetical protein